MASSREYDMLPGIPLFSFLVPIYNSERYLDDCLSSIAKQSYGDFEVIMIDDGSTDGSAGIARSYASTDKRFHYYHQNNTGTSGATNRALSMARGAYIINLDNDDYVDERLLENSLDIIKQHSPDVIQFQSIFFDGFGECHREMFIDDGILLRDKECAMGDGYFPGEFLRTHSRKIMKSSTIKGLYFEGSSKGADGSFIRKVLFRSTTVYLSPEHMFFVRVLPTSESRKPDPPDLYKEWFTRLLRDVDFCAKENEFMNNETPFWVFSDFLDMFQMFSAKAIIVGSFDRHFVTMLCHSIKERKKYLFPRSLRERLRWEIWLKCPEMMAKRLARKLSNGDFLV